MGTEFIFSLLWACVSSSGLEHLHLLGAARVSLWSLPRSPLRAPRGLWETTTLTLKGRLLRENLQYPGTEKRVGVEARSTDLGPLSSSWVSGPVGSGCHR